ncbi:hypothetical protein [Anaerosporobacter faecicola]|uniref:hypothetical protein n=1 Tax=Anaerosporobacter faecicola TaxID=2718714 RepID=UPI001438ACB3|nr:hypothetical protein [Anaerosporobacter faecicola]
MLHSHRRGKLGKLRPKHQVNITYEELLEIYKTPYSWSLYDTEEIEDIIYYLTKPGAVIWIKDVETTDEMRDNEWKRTGYKLN